VLRLGGGRALALLDRAEDRADLDLGALLDRDLRQAAAGRGVELERDLVGLQLDDRLVRLDLLADLLEPFGDRGLGDRFAEGRDLDLHAHVSPRPMPFRRRPAGRP
jgi:hypothetical protein